MEELRDTVNGIDVIYKHKKRKWDTKHLIVIFSGFGVGEFSYDFENALSECPAEVIWIKDCFNNHCSYYVCRNFEFDVENAVINFIEMKLKDLKLEKEHCTLAGFSKGGSAALYFGIKYDFKNILSTVPQFYIGSYAKNIWPAVAQNMMGEITDEKVEYLDQLIPKVIKEDENRSKNIYLLTSPADKQYKSEVVPNINLLEKYDNFNLLITNSVLVRQHNQVTSHHVPLILSIFYSLCVGATPKYGKRIDLITDHTGKPNEIEHEHIIFLNNLKIDCNGVLFIKGVSIISGKECPSLGDIKSELILQVGLNELVIPLESVNDANTTRMLYAGYFMNYDNGSFGTPLKKGIDIKCIPNGKYKAYIKTTCGGITKTSELKAGVRTVIENNSNSLHIVNQETQVYFIKE